MRPMTTGAEIWVGESRERLELSQVEAVLVNVMSEIIKLFDTNEALLGVGENTMGGESFEDIPQKSRRCCFSNENVINVHVG